MIRDTILFLIIMALVAYAYRDWFKPLCGLIFLMAVIRHEIMPSAMFGITGLNPWNFLLINVLMAFVLQRGRENLKWDAPPHLSWLLALSIVAINVALLRTAMNPGPIIEFSERTNFDLNVTAMYIDYLINPIKWVLPSMLLFMGCNSAERFRWAVFSMLAMYLLLALLVIRWMPLGLLTDGEALQSRAARVLGRDVGYYRTNLSIMLAGGCWMMMGLSNYYKKYAFPIYGVAAIMFLAMLLTAGRGGWLAWAVLALVMGFAKWRKYLLMVPVLGLLALPFIPSSIMDRLTEGFSDSGDEQADYQATLSEDDAQLDTISAGRSLLWPLIVDRINEQPVIGYGFYGIVNSGASIEYFETYDWGYFHPHNAYLQLIVDNGYLLSLPLLLFFLIVTRYAWILFRRAENPEQMMAGAACFALVMAFLIGGLTGQSFYPEERSFGMWCSIGLLMRAWVQYKSGETFEGKVSQFEKVTAPKPKTGWDTKKDKGRGRPLWETG